MSPKSLGHSLTLLPWFISNLSVVREREFNWVLFKATECHVKGLQNFILTCLDLMKNMSAVKAKRMQIQNWG
jgi:hypothetical protein